MDPFARLDAIVSQYSPVFSTNRLSSSTSAFVHAVANAPSTEFIRAANPAQASVYTINVNQLNVNKAGELEVKEVRRKTVAVATPLKKAGAGKPRRSRTGSKLDDDNDPEVPLRAALKLIDMYPQSADKGLREKILEMIEEDQDQAARIRAYLRPKEKAPLSLDEQTRIRQLEDDVRQLEEDNARLRFKVDSKIRAETARQFELAEASVDGDESPIIKRQRGKLPMNDTAEDDETINFQKLKLVENSLLMDAETPDISQLIAQTPMRLDTHGNWDRTQHIYGTGVGNSEPRTPSPRGEETFDDTPRGGDAYDDSLVEDDTVEIGDDKGNILDREEKYPSPFAAQQSVPPLVPTKEQVTEPAIRETTPSHSPSPSGSKIEPEVVVEDSLSSEDASKMRIFTHKIWAIAGDVLVPNNHYEAGKGSGRQPNPDFSRTRDILQSIVDEASPSSTSSVEAHRVLTAALLLFLTSRDTSTVENPTDAFSATMIEARELIDAVISDRGWKKENKVIFTWVGKKLLKSDGGRRLRCNFD